MPEAPPLRLRGSFHLHACKSMANVRLLALAAFSVVAATGCAPTQRASAPTVLPSTYTALGQQVLDTLQAGYHTPSELTDARWQTFWTEADRAFAESNTDLEVAARFEAAARALGVSHFKLYKPEMLGAGTPRDTTAARPPVSLEMRDDGIAVLAIDQFSLQGTFGAINGLSNRSQLRTRRRWSSTSGGTPAGTSPPCF